MDFNENEVLSDNVNVTETIEEETSVTEEILVRDLFCINCGHQIIEGSNFCTKCGTKVETRVERVVVQKPMVEKKPKEKKFLTPFNIKLIKRGTLMLLGLLFFIFSFVPITTVSVEDNVFLSNTMISEEAEFGINSYEIITLLFDSTKDKKYTFEQYDLMPISGGEVDDVYSDYIRLYRNKQELHLQLQELYGLAVPPILELRLLENQYEDVCEDFYYCQTRVLLRSNITQDVEGTPFSLIVSGILAICYIIFSIGLFIVSTASFIMLFIDKKEDSKLRTIHNLVNKITIIGSISSIFVVICYSLVSDFVGGALYNIPVIENKITTSQSGGHIALIVLSILLIGSLFVYKIFFDKYKYSLSRLLKIGIKMTLGFLVFFMMLTPIMSSKVSANYNNKVYLSETVVKHDAGFLLNFDYRKSEYYNGMHRIADAYKDKIIFNLFESLMQYTKEDIINGKATDINEYLVGFGIYSDSSSAINIIYFVPILYLATMVLVAIMLYKMIYNLLFEEEGYKDNKLLLYAQWGTVLLSFIIILIYVAIFNSRINQHIDHRYFEYSFCIGGGLVFALLFSTLFAGEPFISKKWLSRFKIFN